MVQVVLLFRGMCSDTTPEPEQTVQSREPRYTLQGLHPHSRYRVSIRAKTNVPGEAVTQEVTTPASGTVLRLHHICTLPAQLNVTLFYLQLQPPLPEHCKCKMCSHGDSLYSGRHQHVCKPMVKSVNTNTKPMEWILGLRGNSIEIGYETLEPL